MLCYDSVWSMFNRWRYILPTLPLSVSVKEKLGKPKEEIGNLIWIWIYVFWWSPNTICVKIHVSWWSEDTIYLIWISSVSIQVISMGTTVSWDPMSTLRWWWRSYAEKSPPQPGMKSWTGEGITRGISAILLDHTDWNYAMYPIQCQSCT